MAKLIKKKFQASTLIEVLVAMVIIMVVFAIAIVIFNQVLSGGISFKKLQVQNELNVLSKNVADAGHLEQDKLWADSIEYTFLSEPLATAGLARLEIKATLKGKAMGSIKKIYQIKAKHAEN